jgi:hypothetical protein
MLIMSYALDYAENTRKITVHVRPAHWLLYIDHGSCGDM